MNYKKFILGEFYTYKVKEKYKKWSYTSTIGGPFFKSHPVLQELHLFSLQIKVNLKKEEQQYKRKKKK